MPLAERYELGETIAHGGMSTVVRATDRRLNRPVAIKLLRHDLISDDAARARFEREARAVAQLESPWIVQVYDVGIDEDRPFLVMELVEGETLTSRLRRTGPLAPATAITLIDQLLSALEVAHANGVVHRDVKPSNVLLPKGGGLKLADFGIAKALDSQATSLTIAGQVLGTPTYLSPEQVSGQPATPSADVYAVGVIFYELLAGRPPFTGDDAIGVALAHQNREPEPLDQLAPDVPPELVSLVHRALTKDPAQRFADAGAMRAALHGGEGTMSAPVADPTPTPTAVLVPPPDEPRRRTGWLVVALVGVALAAAVAVALAAGGDDQSTAAEGPEETVERSTTTDPPTTTSTTEATTTTTTTTVPPTTTTTTAPPTTAAPRPADATSIEELAALLATDPEAYGSATSKLIDQLTKLTDSDPDKQAKAAEKLLGEIEKWADNEELDAEAAAVAYELVSPYAAVEDDEGDGPGDGHGKPPKPGSPGEEDRDD